MLLRHLPRLLPLLLIALRVILSGPAASSPQSLALPGKLLVKGRTIPPKNSSLRFGLEPAIQVSRLDETPSCLVSTPWLFVVRPSTQTKLSPLRTPLTLGEESRLPGPRAVLAGTLFYPSNCP